MKDAAPYMSYIDIFPSLSADAYYRTDTHWKQECLLDTADVLLAAMKNTSSHASAGASVPPKASSEDSLEGYTLHTLDIPFYGVYHGHSALKLPADTIYYLTSDVLDQCIVTSYSSGKPVQKELYNMQKASGRDAYEMFLSGSEAFLTLENPLADTKKELVIFRDSFGSSLAPLLLKDYAKITLIDIRYIQSAYIGNFITFHDQDVLFLYSTLLLNNSEGLR